MQFNILQITYIEVRRNIEKRGIVEVKIGQGHS
jgi:hypothetical protein